MKVPYGYDHLGNEELHLVLVEPSVELQVMEKLTSTYVVHDEIHPVVLLEHVVHLHDEGVVHFQHYQLLKFGALYHTVLNQILFQ